MSNPQDTLREIRDRITKKMDAQSEKGTSAEEPAKGLGATAMACAHAEDLAIVDEYIHDESDE